MNNTIMPSTGGSSDKYGNRYEGYLTVGCMADVLDCKADFIYLEPLGMEGDGIEFYLSKNGIKKYYQVKRQNTIGKWTLSNLENNKILSNFWNKLLEENSFCYFVSSYGAQELDEFTDYSRKISFSKFIERLSDSKKLEKSFKELCGYWKCSERESYDSLKRIYVKTIDEDFLSESVEYKLFPLVEGDSATVKDVLAQYALKRVTEKLSTDEIWKHLKKRGFYPKEINENSEVLKTTLDINNKYISYLQKKQITEEPIPRKEAEKIIKIITSSNRTDAIVIGKAGMGKSNIILQTMLELDHKEISYFVIRADRLTPTISPELLGSELGLPDSPVKILSAISNGKKGVLIIDQLDSMSLISGRHPEFFECINEMVRQSKLFPNLRLLIGCREFDLEQDSRFLTLINENDFQRVYVKSLADKEIYDVLKSFGFENEMNEKQLKLLSIPLNLKLLKEIQGTPEFNISNFDNQYYLYDMFWETKENNINNRSKFRVQWTGVIDKLCEYMDDNQILSVPKIIVDDLALDARLMASENVLILEQDQYSFFHEEFFDYAFARRFISKSMELSNYLKRTDQDLIRRTQVRQILNYERKSNFLHYLNNFETITTDPEIRFHVKEVALAFISQIKRPKDLESDLIISLIKYPNKAIYRHVLRLFYGSVFWYNKLDSLNLIEEWLASENEIYLNNAMWLNRGVQNQIPDRVAELIEPYVNKSDFWNNMIVNLVKYSSLEKGNKMQDLFLKLIDDGILDDITNGGDYGTSLWKEVQYSKLANLSEKYPQMGSMILKHYLKRRISLSLPTSPNPFGTSIPRYQFDAEPIITNAKNGPEAFVKDLFYIMMGLMENNKIVDSNEPYLDQIWVVKYFGRQNSFADILLESMIVALKILAKENVELFKIYETQLLKSNLATARFLLLSSYSANGKEFVNNAINYLVENPKSLETGYINSTFWISKKLIESIRPFCSDEQLRNIENLILNYYPANMIDLSLIFYPEIAINILEHHIERCKVQFGLLEATPPYNRSKIIRNRLKELKTELNIETTKAPEPLEAKIVSSPINKMAAEDMSDTEWLNSFKKYSKEGHSLQGGSLELSRLLETFVKKDPKRFSRLLYKFPSDTNINYFEAVLNGIADSDLDINDITDLCIYSNKITGFSCGKSICDTFSKLANKNLSEEALEIVSWYAINDPDPKEELWNSNNSFGEEYFGGKIFDAGMNSVRGNAALTIQNLIINDETRIKYFLPTLEKIVQDPIIAVRSCVIETLRGVLAKNKDLALNLLKKLLNIDEILLKATPIEYFLYQAFIYASSEDMEYLLTIINKMITSNLEDVIIVGGKIATYASIYLEFELPQMRFCLNNSEAHRKGVAEVLARYILSLKSVFIDRLINLFNDPSHEVQKEVSTCFRQLKKDNILEYEYLITKFINSNAFLNNYDYLFWALKSTKKLPISSLDACEKFFEFTKQEAGDLRTSAAGMALDVSQIVLRIYNETKNDETKNRCLNLIDYMLEIGVYNFENKLNDLERK